MNNPTRTPPRVPFVITRRTLLTGVGAALAALMGSAANPRAQGRAFASTLLAHEGDVDILKFGLQLEQVKLDFLQQALATGTLQQALVPVITRIRDQDTEHVAKLTQLIVDAGGTPQAPERYAFGPLATSDRILQVAQTVQEVCVGGYNGATARATERYVVRWCASITQVESGHVAVLRILRGQMPTTGAYAALFTPDAATHALAQFTP